VSLGGMYMLAMWMNLLLERCILTSWVSVASWLMCCGMVIVVKTMLL